MSEARKLVLKLIQENRVSLEEAEVLLDALAPTKASEPPPPSPERPPASDFLRTGSEQVMRQAGPKVEQFMGSINTLLDSVANQWGPVIEKRFDRWFQPGSTTTAGDSSTSEWDAPQTSSQTFDLEPGTQRLFCTNPWGDIAATGYDGTTVQIESVKRVVTGSGLAERLERITWKAHPDGDTLRLVAEGTDGLKPEQLRLHLAIRIPRHLSLELQSTRFDLNVSAINQAEGECRLQTQSGDLHLDQVTVKTIHGETASGNIKALQNSEHLYLRTASGNITLEGSLIDAHLQSQSGTLRLSGAVAQRCKAETVSGDIQMGLVAGQGRLELSTTSGDIELGGELAGEVTLNSTSGDLCGDLRVLNSASVILNTHSGDVDLSLQPDSSCRLDLSSRSGDVECRLELSALEATEHSLRARIGDGQGLLRAQTLSGDILIN